MAKKILVSLLVLAALSGCAQEKPASAPVGQEKAKAAQNLPPRIGYSIPLTGKAVTYTEVQKKAADLALDEINAAGGIKGQKLELLYEDSKLDPSVAVTAMKKLIEVDNVPVIFGFSSGEVLAMAAQAERSQRVLIAPLASAAELQKTGSFSFRISPADTFQGKILAEVLRKDGRNSVAVLHVNNDWGSGLKDSFSEEYKRLGGTVAAIESSKPDANDFRAQLVKLREANADALVIFLHPQETIHAVRQIRELKFKQQIYGGDTFSADAIYKEIPKLADGIVFTLPAKPSSEVFQQFAKKYEAKYGVKPDINAAACYDAVLLVAKVFQEVGTAPQAVRDRLLATKGFAGASGDISFDQNGSVISKKFDVLIVKSGKYQRR